MLELAEKAGQLGATGFLVVAVVMLWRKLSAMEKEVKCLQEKRVTEQKEWLQTATELARLQHRATRAIEDFTGRKQSPPPSR